MTHHLPLPAGTTLALLLLAGCDTQQPPAPVPADLAAAGGSGSVMPPDQDRPADTNITPAGDAPGTAAGDTQGGDGSQLVLSPLSAADIRGVTLAGELACSFAAEASGPPLLLARGDVADADGRATFAVKIGDTVEQGLAQSPGGYDGMLEGGRFGTRGMTLTVRNVRAPAQRGGEAPALPAELLAQRGDGAERVFPGTWTCGP